MFRIDRSSVEYLKTSQPYVVTVPRGSAPPDETEATGEAAPAQPHQVPYPTVEMKRQAEAEAQAIVNQAHSHADQIIAQAAQEADRIRTRAYNKAIEDGQAEAKSRLEAQSVTAKKELADLIQKTSESMAASMEETVNGWEEDLLDLSIDIARKIINTELERNDEAFRSLVQNALSHMRGDAKVTLHVSPREYERYFSEGNAVFHIGTEKLKIAVTEDPLLERGGCVVESEGEMINAGVEQQLNALANAMEQDEG